MQRAEIVVRSRLRRLYKTRWERAKRKRLRESRVEVVEFEIPRSLANRLRAWTPKGVGFKPFLLRALSARTGGKPLLESAEHLNGVQRPLRCGNSHLRSPVIGRNSRCVCGSGKKWKQCCGQRRYKKWILGSVEYAVSGHRARG